jgi:hypothetical protein
MPYVLAGIAFVFLGAGLAGYALLVRRKAGKALSGDEERQREALKDIREGDWLCEQRKFGKAMAAYQRAFERGAAPALAKELKVKYKRAKEEFHDEINRLNMGGWRLCHRWDDDCYHKLEAVGDPDVGHQLVDSVDVRGALKVPSDFDFDDVWRRLMQRMGAMVLNASGWAPKSSGQATIDYAIHCMLDEILTNARGKGKGNVILAWDLTAGWIRIVDEREWFDYELRVLMEMKGHEEGRPGEYGRRKVDRTGGGGMGLLLVRKLADRFHLKLDHRYLKQFKTGNEFTIRCPGLGTSSS